MIYDVCFPYVLTRLTWLTGLPGSTGNKTLRLPEYGINTVV